MGDSRAFLSPSSELADFDEVGESLDCAVTLVIVLWIDPKLDVSRYHVVSIHVVSLAF